MRFLHLATVYPPYPAGMSHAAKEAAEGLARRGHQVVVATLPLPGGPGAGVFQENGVEVRRLSAFPRYGLAGWPWPLWKMLREPWDGVLVHVPFFGAQDMLALALRFGLRPKRLAVYYHMDIAASGFVRMVAEVSRRLSLPVLLKKADVVLAASKSYAETSWLRDQWARVEPKLRIVPFGVDVERFTPAPSADDTRKRIVFVGGLDRPHYFKGLAVLLGALAGVAGRDDWSLEVVGDGELRPEYEAQAARLGIAPRVRFAGRCPPAALPDCYRGAYVHVLPSLDRSEAFGLVVLEAQSCGVPSIVSDLPGVREAVEAPATGLLVPPGDVGALRTALVRLLDDPSLQHAMGQAARARAVAGYTWERHLDALEKALG
jgi:glycosyltransferase involved in cell wall biosynthesis